MIRRLLASIGLVLLAVAAGGAQAGSYCDYSNILDPDNLVKNTVQAVESVKAVTQLVDKYKKQVEQYKTQVEQLKSLADSGSALVRTTQDLADAQQLLTALRSLHGSAQQVRGRFDQRLGQMKATSTSWESYIEWERNRIARNVGNAVAGAQEEQRVLARVQRDYEFAREVSQKIPESAGIHQAAQIMNLQVNRMISQQAELARIMAPAAAAAGETTEALQQRAERAKFRAEQFQQLNNMTKARQQSERSSLEGLR
ncbi:MAG: hypothetical protein HYX47_13290 [Burkholderiales bacterium]|nr:hypothetical protein [Burkholderiales bacterium]